MPTPELMTWVPAQKRWTKRYRGRRYYVSVRQLGTVETKEASLQAANAWWRDKQADLDVAYRAGLTSPRTPPPVEDVAAALIGSPEWDSIQALVDAAAQYLAKLPPSPEAEEIQERMHEAAYREDETGDEKAWEPIAADLRERLLSDLFRRVVVEGQPLPEGLKEHLPPARAHQIEYAVKSIRGESAADPERTVQAQVDAWLQKQQSIVRIGGMTAARFANIQKCIRYFSAFIGESADVKAIDADALEGFHNFCLAKIADKRQGVEGGWSPSYARAVFTFARSFIRWLAGRGIIPTPANLISRGFCFGSTVERVDVWTAEEVREILRAATGLLKLALLLMLNCGMTQKDVADLRDDEVDWHRGRIIRKRSKTRDQKNAPEVNYRLWPSTFTLLKKHRSGSECVLLTARGSPLIRKTLEDGKFVAYDMLASYYNRMKKPEGFRKPMKLLRKTSASLLESHEVYGRFTSLFLGHAPSSMKDRHYAAPPQALFDEAVQWLGDQLGIAQISV
jgi:integrase